MKWPYPFKGRPGRKTAAAAPAFPLILNRHRVYIFPTPFGFFFIFVLLAMLIGSVNYNNNLGFLLVFLLGALLLVSIFHTYRNVLGLSILSVSAEPVFAGDLALFSLRIRAGRILRCAVAFSFKNGPVALENLSPATDQTIIVSAETKHRGEFVPGKLTVWSRFPLGLFHAWSHPDPGAACLVYPRPRPARRTQEISAIPDDAARRGNADDFRGLRTYQAGDPVRRIAWKTLSRGMGVFLKDFGTDSQEQTVFDFDHIPGDIETRLSGLCDLVLKSHGANAAYGVKIPGRLIRPDRGELQKQKCLQALALFRG